MLIGNYRRVRGKKKRDYGKGGGLGVKGFFCQGKSSFLRREGRAQAWGVSTNKKTGAPPRQLLSKTIGGGRDSR